MNRSLKISLIALALAGMLWLTYSIFAASTLTVTGQGLADGSLRFDTQLPNADCTKTFSARFPFVKVTCERSGLNETLP